MLLANDAFLLSAIIGGIGILISIVVFLLKRLLSSFEESLDENTKAVRKLTDTITDIGGKVLVHETRMEKIDDEIILIRQKIHNNSSAIQELLIKQARDN
jgi:hypothetical protein